VAASGKCIIDCKNNYNDEIKPKKERRRREDERRKGGVGKG